MSARPQYDNSLMADDDSVPPVIYMTDDEARLMFDENAQYWLGISGDEFLRKWHAGEFGDIDDHPDHVRIMHVAFLLPFVLDGPIDW